VSEFNPSRDLTWELVRLGNRDQIVAVFVAGRLRLWQGWPVGWGGRAFMHEIANRARDAVGRAPIQRIHPVSSERRAAAAGKEPRKP
jgi:5-methylthioadenosine/S-adenosylhomocysteine deaminase